MHARLLVPCSLLVAVACAAPSAGGPRATPSPAAPTVPAVAARPTGHPAGTLLIVGGGTQPRALVQRFVELAGGPGRARIAILPMASAEAAESGREKAEELRGLGADAFVLNLTREQAERDSVVRLVQGATGIWFPGGDQARLTRVLQGTATLRAIQARYRAGAVVGGTSAGAAIMSDSMITGDQVRAGEDTSGYFGDEFPRVARHAIVVAPGFGFLPGAIVDQHFLRRERHNRLLSVVLERPTMLGVGIDEGTALRVDPDGRWGVEGASAVIVYDARDARITPPGAPRLGAAAVRLHLLPAGSTFDPRTGEARLPEG
ncbi:MAG TPA: cyanophycinase [Gemmatimonadaceae bacterium]|nr:cyanophycinase [Gemmatimonadaceae bacterium]